MTSFVQSLQRGLEVIRAFDADARELTLSDVARRTGLSRAAARRFLLTLVDLGYVRTDGRLFSLSPRTVTSVSTLRSELRRVRDQGGAIVDQELEEGLRAAAAPVRNGDARVVAAINVSSHASRSSIESIRRDVLPPLLATAARIETDVRVASSSAKRSA